MIDVAQRIAEVWSRFKTDETHESHQHHYTKTDLYVKAAFLLNAALPLESDGSPL